MRILHVVPTYLPATRYGGPIYSVHGLCAALASLGHDVHVATTSVDGPNDSPVAHGVPVDVDGVKVWYFRSNLLRRLYYSHEMAAALQTLVQTADVVHLHSVFLWPTFAAARAATRNAVPYVVSPRGMLVRELIERKSTAIKAAWLALIESTTLAHAAAVHLTSRRELQDASQLPLPLTNPFVIPNGVALDAGGFQSEPAQPPSSPYALYLGRLHWKKGLDQALHALVGTDVRLVICGNDDENYLPVLERIVRENGIEAQVRFEGYVSGARKQALLASAAFLVLPSRNENFGNVVVEAMAAATAVLVSDCVGAAEVVLEARAGLVSDPSAASLRAAMLELWNDVGMRERLGNNGARYVVAELVWPRIASRMAERYAALAGKRMQLPKAPATLEDSCSTTSRR
jgi:glycosyltransferase involved in cell wall biosynthesis